PPDAGGGGDFGAWNEAGGRALAGGRLLTAALSAIIRRSRCVSADWPCTRDCRLSRTIMIGPVCQAPIQWWLAPSSAGREIAIVLASSPARADHVCRIAPVADLDS